MNEGRVAFVRALFGQIVDDKVDVIIERYFLVAIEWFLFDADAKYAATFDDQLKVGPERLAHVRVNERVKRRAHVGNHLHKVTYDDEKVRVGVFERMLVDIVEHLIAPIGRPAHDVTYDDGEYHFVDLLERFLFCLGHFGLVGV